MASFDLPDMPETRVTPTMMMGAASPLWAYFGAAAAGGIAYWWMARWTRPVNLEALFATVTKTEEVLPSVETLAAPAIAAADAVVEATETVIGALAEASAELPLAPVGGESAPISPIVETIAAAEPAVAEEPAAIEAAPEPIAEATADPLPDPVAKPRPRKPNLPPAFDA